MHFDLDPGQRDFATSLDGALRAAAVPTVIRAWAAGDPEPVRALWRRLAELGVTALAVPEELGGIGAGPVDLVVAAERLGHWGVPGPVAESIAVAPHLLATAPDGPQRCAALADGDLIVTVAHPPLVPRALDSGVADLVLLAGSGSVGLAQADTVHASVDPARRLSDVIPTGEPWIADTATAFEYGALVTSAQSVGAAQAMLDGAVAYAGQRSQFGRVIGSYQAVKHALADVHIAIELARPLVYGAALSLADGSPQTARDISAAKAAASDAALLAARTSLQTHGAIGYTQEHDLSLLLLRAQALRSAWGDPRWHRSRVLAELSSAAG